MKIKVTSALEPDASAAGAIPRPPQRGKAFVGEHATGDRGNGRPTGEGPVGKNGVRRCPRAGLPRRHAIDDGGNARAPDGVAAQHARFDG